MNIALDYDKTYTADKDFWNEVIKIAKDRGHDVRITTARSATKDTICDKRMSADIPIMYCDGVAKKWVLHHHFDWDVDIWIDDKPDNILANSVATKEVLAEWRASDEHMA